jgi:Zn finger protein HypA/HybF involved in hydrogenase expression
MSDVIPVSCECGRSFRVKAEAAGRRVKCPGCGQPVDVVAGESLPPGSSIPFTITANLIGLRTIKFRCPKCHAGLTSPLSDAGNREHCPECSTGFTVPGQSEREESEREASEKRLAAQREKEDRAAAKALVAKQAAEKAERERAIRESEAREQQATRAIIIDAEEQEREREEELYAVRFSVPKERKYPHLTILCNIIYGIGLLTIAVSLAILIVGVFMLLTTTDRQDGIGAESSAEAAAMMWSVPCVMGILAGLMLTAVAEVLRVAMDIQSNTLATARATEFLASRQKG